MTTPETVGRYVIKRELGRGGMAIVYLAYDPHFERQVALKVLPSYFVHEADFRVRFEREAKTLAQLEHFAIVPVYDYGQDESPFLVMRYMKGGTLKDRMKEGAISVKDATEVFRRIGAALDAAHEIGIIHRDLKPDNILFDEVDRAYLSDFGIVKLAESSVTFTKTGGILGTPAYMSPEQATGAKGIDRRSDIYSLGVILYEMLAGRAPYQADTTVRLIMKHVTEPIPDILNENPALPPDCDAIIRRVMSKTPEERFDSCAELVSALDAVLTVDTSPGNLGKDDSEATRLDEPPLTETVSPREADTASQQPRYEMPGAEEVGPVSSETPELHLQPQESSTPPSKAPTTSRGRRWIVIAGMGAVGVIALVLLAGLFILSRYRQTAASTVQATETAVAEAALQVTLEAEQTSAAMATMAIYEEETRAALAVSVEQTQVVETRAFQETATSVSAASTATEEARPTFTPAATPIGGGELIAFDSARDGNREIYVMNSDGSNIVRLTNDEADDGDPKWSPDGTRILFGSLRDGDWELYTMDPDGSNVIQLTDNGSTDWAGKWSPDGTQIVFASDRDGNLEIYRMNADGSGQERLTSNTVIDAFPSWSPDGGRILFESVVSEGGRDFFLIDPDGSNLTRLMVNSDFDRNAAWSPDGALIAYVTNRNRNDEIYVMNADGSNPTRVTNNQDSDFAPVWAPDGRRIIFVSERDGNREIYMMNMDGSNQINLTNSPADDSFASWQRHFPSTE